MPNKIHNTHTQKQAAWSIDRAREFYSINEWSEGYFDIDTQGHIVAKPDKVTSIDLMQVCEEIKNQGLSLPVLVRFPQILRARVKEIDAAFQQAALSKQCDIKHTACYPIKVNQQRTVIEQILSSDCDELGLEVGSKTELLVALGLIKSKQRKLICNGYKDRAYIRLALYAQCMGVDVFIVIENPSELPMIRQECERIGVTPQLGLRLKLNSIAAGRWQNSGGKDAKFGLDTQDVLYCLEKLTQWDRCCWLKLIHFHMGSQISKLNEFAVGIQEAMTVFGEIVKRAFELEFIDVGGGLAIDYASQHDASYFSRAYSIQEYAHTIVNTIVTHCQQHAIKLPTIITENGRAIAAHHAMLITNIVKVRDDEEPKYEPVNSANGCQVLYEKGHALLRAMHHNCRDIGEDKHTFERMLQEKFLQGEVGLQQRAWAESVISNLEASHESLDRDLSHHSSTATEQYYCNFSIFQSMPDVWGLGQIFPIVPLSRLDELPTKNTRLHDLTCDSDGQISRYAFNKIIHDYITLHELSEEEEYMLGFYLLGAYQEVLGDMHNLFGDTHALNVEKNSNGRLQFSEIEIGDCVNEMLASIHLSSDWIIQQCEQYLSDDCQAMNVTTQEILEEINNALYGYTYLDSIDRPAHRIKR